jgi:hypothetical protein
MQLLFKNSFTGRSLEPFASHKYTLSLHKTPRKDSGPCNAALGHRSGAAHRKFSGSGGARGRGRGAGGQGAYLSVF